MSATGPSRKWCRRDTASEMHRLTDIGLPAHCHEQVKPSTIFCQGVTTLPSEAANN